MECSLKIPGMYLHVVVLGYAQTLIHVYLILVKSSFLFAITRHHSVGFGGEQVKMNPDSLPDLLNPLGPSEAVKNPLFLQPQDK